MGAHRALVSSAERHVVRDYRNGKTLKQLATDFDVSKSAIFNLLVRHGQPRRNKSVAGRKLTLNERAFSRVTPDSAYWTGFMMADGNIQEYVGKSDTICLKLQVADIHHIEKFRKFLGSNHSIGVTPPTSGVEPHGYNYVSKGCARISVKSNQLSADLARFGVVPRKSTKEQVKGGLEFNRHFWRGVIDGDGGVRIRPVVALCGARTLLVQFKRFVKSICDGDVYGKITRRPYDCYHVYFYGRTARTIVDVLYSNAPTYLDRKMEAAQEIMQS